MPNYVLPAGKEREVCVASYYDFSDRVPERFQDRERGVFFVNGSRLRQDPQSHHLVVDHAGIGAELVRAAEAALEAQGCYMVEVTSHNRREAAHRFYEKLGYEKTSVRLAKML